jgi:hypothetical protein
LRKEQYSQKEIFEKNVKTVGLAHRLAATAAATPSALSVAAISTGLLSVALSAGTARLPAAGRLLGHRSVQLLSLALSTSSSVVASLLSTQPSNNLFFHLGR